ncbi:DUF4214 domain-containing protein [Massilia sp. KIM]|uniref:DUF4214 domain-containing protein n=1 Tax=Massilia sp. KIM TaxID=1955422 RepID=UPI0015C36BB7|nr:DUF4214 domain-containing protein [Massilia sp. KIM]
MPIRHLFLALLSAVLLAACGGGEAETPASQPRSLAAVTSSLHTFTGLRANYRISPSGSGYLVEDLVKGGPGVAVPRSAHLRFADATLSPDTDGVAGQVYRLYQAAFARTPDPAGVGYWIDALARGASIDAVAQAFTQSDEYRSVYGGAPTNRAVVERYYLNVLGRAGEPAGIAFWTDALDRAAATRASVLAGFSESLENQAVVAAAIRGGVLFVEPGVSYVPAAHAGRALTVSTGDVVTLDGRQSTVSSNRQISYAWTLSARPEGSNATLVQAGSARPAFRADKPGNYEASLTVSDGVATSAVSKVAIVATWKPDDAALPANGNFVYLESDGGDYIGGGGQRLYTGADSLLSVSPLGAGLQLRVTGDDNWDGQFVGMNTLTRLQPGYYAGLTRYPFHDPARGGLSWSGEGRGCNQLTGWFAIDSISYQGTAITAVDLRFEQHCEGGVPALRGRVRWSAADSTAPPGPGTPPAGLWQPASGATPSSGNYIYLESTQGDYIGGGGVYTYTQANASMSIAGSGAQVNVRVEGDEDWRGEFVGMSSLAQLKTGFYGALQRYPFHNPARGGLSWSGEGRGCNQLLGWMVVDHVAYSGGTMTALDLRFEQRCEGGASALHGKIRWRAGDTTAPPGPVAPPPAGLWRPAAGATPTSGNYVYLESSPGDYIGGGATRTFTDANATLALSAVGARLVLNIGGASWYSGDFAGMNSLTQLQPGYYGDLRRYPFHNPVKGGLSFSGDGRGCNTLIGWFVIDKISFVQGVLADVDLRFEQRCEGAMAPLRGRVRWSAPG